MRRALKRLHLSSLPVQQPLFFIETVALVIPFVNGQTIVGYSTYSSFLFLFCFFKLLFQVKKLIFLKPNVRYNTAIDIYSSSQKLHNMLRNRISSSRILPMVRPSLEAGLMRWVNL